MVKVKNTPNSEKKICILIVFVRGQQSQVLERKDIVIREDIIQYKFIKQISNNCLQNQLITFQTILYTVDPKKKPNHIRIDPNFQINVEQIIFNMQGIFVIIVKSALQDLRQQFQSRLEVLNQQIFTLKQTISQFQKVPRDNPELIKKYSIGGPSLNMLHVHSQAERRLQNIQIDIGILFSQPLYDKQKMKPTLPAVDFRSQISRINIALQSSLKPNIVIRSQIGTPQSLKNMIKLSKPKILHIVCHGSSEGNLQFQEDSRNTLGQLRYLKPQDVKNLLKNQINNLPDLVFVNSCHSQLIGQSFFQLGVKHVISVNSSDPISDEAAMNFSQNFYRKIFKGETVDEAFKCKDQLMQAGLCCCSHSQNLQPHRKTCRWLKLQQKYPNAHKDYHIPSSKCQCPLRNLNRHKVECQWAQKTLFQINQDFRIKKQKTDSGTGTGTVTPTSIDSSAQYRFPKLAWQFPEYYDKQKRQLVICCCPTVGKRPHAEANKFKLFSKNQSQILIHVTAQNRPPQIDDLTEASLLYAHQKSKAIFGRQRQLYQFLRSLQQINFIAVYGKSGVGLTTFTVKASTYMMQRRVFSYFFFIDLYDIKDEIIFRYKFNQVTNFQYNGNTINQVCLKDRILLLFDNCDDFINKNPVQFYQQIQNILKWIPKCKIIITFKEQTENTFDQKRIFCRKFQLSLFETKYAVAFLNNKMKDKTDISVGYQQFRKLVNQFQVLKIPKVIQSLSQSFPITSKGLKYDEIMKNVQGIKISDTNKLTQQVLQKLQKQSKDAYQFLIFVSQFSDGITFSDINMFSTYFRDNKSIKLPVKQNWQEHYLMLFEKQNNNENFNKQDICQQLLPETNLITSVSQPQYRIGLNTIDSNRPSIHRQKSNQRLEKFAKLEKIQSQSYFIDKSGEGRFIVKRFIRDFVWKKHQNQVTYSMKFLYIAYFSVILQMLFKILKQEKYIHEQLTTYSAVSQSGIFSFSTKLQDSYERKQIDMTKSAKFAISVLDQLEYIFIKNVQLQRKMKQTDFSTFILNHKHDFLKIYDNNWIDVYDHLKRKNQGQQKIFTIMFQNLMIYIPTAFKIANAQEKLLEYVVNGSSKQIKRFSQFSRPVRSLILQLKLYIIQIGISLQKDKKVILKIIQSAESTISCSKFTTNEYIIQHQNVRKMFRQQMLQLDLIQDQKKLKQMPNNVFFINIEQRIQQFRQTYNPKQQADTNQFDLLIKAKQGLIMSLIFLKIVAKKAVDIRLYLDSPQGKILIEKIKHINESCMKIFKHKSCIKLLLKSKLCFIQMSLIVNQIFNTDQDSKLFKDIDECEQIFMTFQNRLRGFTEFDDKIKELKQLIKQKMWKTAAKRMIFMKAYPLAAKNYPIIKNLVRKKNNFRQQIQKILSQKNRNHNNDYPSQRTLPSSPSPVSKSKDHKSIIGQKKNSLDVCTKYEILTKSKILQESKAKCSLMFITVDVKIHKQKLYFICQNEEMGQDLVQINKQMAKYLIVDNVLILLLSGVNTKNAAQRLAQLSPNPPVIIALHSDQIQQHDEIGEPHDLETDQIYQFIKRQNQIKKAELTYTKHFIKRISQESIQSTEDIRIIHKEATTEMCRQTGCKLVKGWIQINRCKKDIHLQYKQGVCRDLSPGYQRNHNIDHKSSQNVVYIRRWRKMIQFFKSLTRLRLYKQVDQNLPIKEKQPFSHQRQYKNLSNSKNLSIENNYNNISGNPQQKIKNKASYINIYGENGCGKTFFIKQIAKILVERQFYDFGVFLFDGKVIQKKFKGDFQAYIKKEAEDYRMPVFGDFQRLLGPKTILIIDDFHHIKPRTDARMKIFMDKIISRKVNLVLVTVSQLKLQILQNMQKIKIEPLDTFELQIFAYNYLNLNNLEQMKYYAKLKQQKKEKNSLLTIKQIEKIPSRNLRRISPSNNQRETSEQQQRNLYMNKRNTTFG